MGSFFGWTKFSRAKEAKDIEVAAVGLGERDVANEGDFFEHVLLRMELVAAAVDDGDGKDGCATGVVLAL